jgi:ADP-ribose pyrophosphatase YjhB (NUDIX family)
MTPPPVEPDPEKPEVALAILHCAGQFLLQLRDDLPTILYPGHWALFGGHLELGEPPDVGIRRELAEEIGHVPQQLFRVDCHEDTDVIRHIYYGELEVALEQLQLGEGQDMALASITDIRRGEHYSARTGKYHPLGAPHQRILLNYLENP